MTMLKEKTAEEKKRQANLIGSWVNHQHDSVKVNYIRELGKSVSAICSHNAMWHHSFSIRIGIALTICSRVTSIHNFYCNFSLKTWLLNEKMSLKVSKSLHMWKCQVTHCQPDTVGYWGRIEMPTRNQQHRDSVAFNDLITANVKHRVIKSKRGWQGKVIITL